MASNNSSCYDLGYSPAFVGVTAVHGAMSVVSFVGALLIIALVVLYKKYRFFTQRLILYLACAELIKSFVEAFNVFGYWVDESVLGLCIAVGFFQQIVAWWVVIATTCIMVDVFIKVQFNKSTEKFEWLYVLLIFFLPIILTSWIPFIFDAYGPEGPICWIKNKNDTYCSDFFLAGAILEFTLYIVPIYILLTVLFFLLTASLILLHKQSKEWAGKFDPESLKKKKRMQTEIQPLLYYPIILIIIHTPVTIAFTYGVSQDIDPSALATLILWYVTAITYHLQGIFITCAFTLDPDTRNKLDCASLRAAYKNYWTRYEFTREYPIEVNSYGDSLKSAMNSRKSNKYIQNV